MTKDNHQIIIGLPDTLIGRFFYDVDLALGISGAIRFAKWAVPTSVAVATIIAPDKVFIKSLEATAFVGDNISKAASSAAGYMSEKAVEAAGYAAGKAVEGAGYLAENAPAYILDKSLRATAFVVDNTMEGAGYAAGKAVEGAGYLAENAPAYILDKSLRATAFVGNKVVEGAGYAAGKVVEGAGYLAENAPAYILDKALRATAFVVDNTMEGAGYAAGKAVEGAGYAAGAAVDYAKENSTVIATAAGVAALATAGYVGYSMYHDNIKHQKKVVQEKLSNDIREMTSALNQDIEDNFKSLSEFLKTNKDTKTLPMLRLEELSKKVIDSYKANSVLDEQKIQSIHTILTTSLNNVPTKTLQEVQDKVMALVGSITLHEHFQQQLRENKVDRSFVDRVAEERLQVKSTGRNLAE